MAPSRVGLFEVVCTGYGFEGEMSRDAAGIVACLFAFNWLACRYQRELDIEGYFRTFVSVFV